MDDNNVNIDLTNTAEIKMLILKTQYLIENYDVVKKEIEQKLYIENGKQDDYLHELELSKLNSIELMSVTKKLKETRITRRYYKDRLELLNTIDWYVKTFLKKGMFAENKSLIDNLNTLTNNQATRQYNPKVIKDLKCAKKKESTNERK